MGKRGWMERRRAAYTRVEWSSGERGGKSAVLPLAELWGEGGQVPVLAAGGAREEFVDPGGWRGLFGRMHSRSRPSELVFYRSRNDFAI